MIPDTPAARVALLGGMIRQNLVAGAPLFADSVLRPKDRGFLAAILASNMRAVSIAVDPVSAAAGLIWPGDHVDLLLTQSIEDTNQPAAHRIAAEIVLSNLRVIAIDQQLMQGAVGSPDGVERNVRTVTLEVTAAEAERVAVAARLGKLSLAVHAALADTPASPDARGVTWAGEVSSARTTAPVRLYRGPDKSEEVHF